MYSVLHGWTDEDCIKILKKCKEAIPKEGGKEGRKERERNGIKVITGAGFSHYVIWSMKAKES
ncbi:hypothetical protein ACLOJK_029668, partial [Asimina triloba]